MSGSLLVKKARDFAVKAHAGLLYGGKDYVTEHLDRVAALVRQVAKDDEEAEVVAYLHDTVEDNKAITLEIIEANFGYRVSKLVGYLTDEPGKNRRERKKATNEKLSKVPEEFYTALVVKPADRTANFIACHTGANQKLLEMYKREHPEFVRAVFRKGLCDYLWSRMAEIVGEF